MKRAEAEFVSLSELEVAGYQNGLDVFQGYGAIIIDEVPGVVVFGAFERQNHFVPTNFVPAWLEDSSSKYNLGAAIVVDGDASIGDKENSCKVKGA